MQLQEFVLSFCWLDTPNVFLLPFCLLLFHLIESDLSKVLHADTLYLHALFLVQLHLFDEHSLRLQDSLFLLDN